MPERIFCPAGLEPVSAKNSAPLGGPLPQLYFTDLFALRRSVTADGVTHELSADEITAAESIGLVEGMPFILGRDGTYDHHLNRFLRSCPTMGVRSLNSLRAYLNDCFFEPATALCLGRSTGAANQPILSNCAPDRCPNSCIARRHLPAWQAAIAHAEAMLEEKRLSNAQRTAIRQDRDRMRKLIAPLLEEGS